MPISCNSTKTIKDSLLLHRANGQQVTLQVESSYQSSIGSALNLTFSSGGVAQFAVHQ